MEAPAKAFGFLFIGFWSLFFLGLPGPRRSVAATAEAVFCCTSAMTVAAVSIAPVDPRDSGTLLS
jgi:hypothetical protein